MNTAPTQWRSFRTVSTLIDAAVNAAPEKFRPICQSLATTPLTGLEIFGDRLPPLMTNYTSEIYLAVVATNTYLLESCYSSTGWLALATPLFLVSQLVLSPVIYIRTALELAIATSEPIEVAHGPYKGQNGHITNACSSRGSTFYQLILHKVRQPWNTFHTVLGIASLALLPILYSPTSLIMTVTRLITCAPLYLFLAVKRSQFETLQRGMQAMQAWVGAAPAGEKPSRMQAQQEITAYLQRHSQLSASQTMAILGTSLPTVPDYTLSLKDLKLTSLPDIIWQLTTVQELNLEGNRLTELSGRINALPYLQKLNVKNNDLSFLPVGLENRPNLHQLQKEGNPKLKLSQAIKDNQQIKKDGCIIQ